MTRKTTQTLLVCGILSSLVYAAMNVFIPLLWPEYSSAGQTVSELSAIGAPTRPVWVATASIYTLMYVAFGLGVWSMSEENRHLRIAAGFIVGHGIFGLFWPPMHLRGNAFTMTDAMHIAFAFVTLLLMLFTIWFAARSQGRAFRLYSAGTVVVWFVFGALTSMDSPGIARNEPTPWIGVWERINIAAFMLWVIVLAEVLLRRLRAPGAPLHAAA